MNEPILDPLVGYVAILVEQVLDDALTPSSVEPMPVVPIIAPTHAVEFVQNTELLIKQRALREGLLPRQICAVARHAQDEVLGALVLIDDLIPVPGRNDGVLHTGLTLGPLEAILTMGILAGILARKRTDVIRDTE